MNNQVKYLALFAASLILACSSASPTVPSPPDTDGGAGGSAPCDPVDYCRDCVGDECVQYQPFCDDRLANSHAVICDEGCSPPACIAFGAMPGWTKWCCLNQ